MKKFIQKHQQKNGIGRGKLQFASTAPWMEENKPIISSDIIAKFRKDIADRHAVRAIQERNQRRLNQQNKVVVDNSKAKAKGTVQDANKVQLNKALSWYGLSNGLGQITNVSDKGRNTPEFGKFIGEESQRPIKTAAILGPILAAPQTALFGMVNSAAGSIAGHQIGKQFGHEKAGEVIGGFALPSITSGFNALTRPMLQRTFSNNFSDAYGYDQIVRIPSMIRDYARGLVGKGPKSHPKIVSNDDVMSVTVERNGKTIKDEINYDQGTTSYGERPIDFIDKSQNRKPTPESSIGRANAVAKYVGVSDEQTPMYIRNPNGSYQYNMENTPYNFRDLIGGKFANNGSNPFEAIQQAKAAEGNPIVTLDFLGRNGGGVNLRHTGTTVKNGEIYDTFVMRDLWDLQPIGSLANNFGKTSIGKKFPTLSKVVSKVGNNPVINREFGRIIGAKPFMLEHPFAVSRAAQNSNRVIDWRKGTMNLFSNSKVPNTKYTDPNTWDMPFDLEIKSRNLTYPLFNYQNSLPLHLWNQRYGSSQLQED